ncbi:sigma factor binding protein 2, chloroplastic-like [Salvia hispanica]|uniref:sigma factor binding protein 2, chloroplastic-like n=1 Tax=Salvia hispanica TaxID=49212 RepID=UPI0020095032|nr:sigma factor binding protein 2, chloroplastic-like [Salvia hispanica]XP_047983030.1 sigma factor binding protein 2, chloroplastic-like [Salvia hispanica]
MNCNDQSIPRLVRSLKKGYKGKKKKSDQLKVVYISSPMKVKTSASRFRSLVQELTGKNSDVSQYMDENTDYLAKDFYHEIDCDDQSPAKETNDGQYRTYSSVSTEDTPTSSDSFQEQMDISVFTSQMREEFQGVFSSNSFYDPSQLDVLGSFDELL